MRARRFSQACGTADAVIGQFGLFAAGRQDAGCADHAMPPDPSRAVKPFRAAGIHPPRRFMEVWMFTVLFVASCAAIAYAMAVWKGSTEE
jgi:hypothetical protein